MYKSLRKELDDKLNDDQREYCQHWFSNALRVSPERTKDYLFREILAAQICMANLTDKEIMRLVSLAEPLTSLFNSLRNRYDIRITVDNTE